MNTKDDVKKFMMAADQEVNSTLQPIGQQSKLYMKLISEEFIELYDAYNEKDIYNIAKEAIDVIVTIEGLLHSLGIDSQKVWDEVARSNHSKISDSGKLLKRADGKVLKPDKYSPADIQGALNADMG